jgi:hypothetical protein
MKSQASGKYYCNVGDIVMCAEQGHLYPAKVLRVETLNNIRKYFIHFQGWHRKWDIWVDERLLTHAHDKERITRLEAGLQGAQAAKESGPKEDSGPTESKGRGRKRAQSKAATVSAPGVSSPSAQAGAAGASSPRLLRSAESADSAEPAEAEDASASGEADEPVVPAPSAAVKQGSGRVMTAEASTRLKKHKRRMIAMDITDEGGDDHPKLVIPFPLKKHLVDEWGLIVADAPRLLPLPRPAESTVGHLIREFLAAKLPKVEEADRPQYAALFEALQLHFDIALPTILLYGQERTQYDTLAAQQPDSQPHDMYGVEHLLRLFGKL